MTYAIAGDNEMRISQGEVGKSSETMEISFEDEPTHQAYLNQLLAELFEQGYQETKYDDLTLLFVQTHPRAALAQDNNLLVVFNEFKSLQNVFDEPIYEKHLGNYAASDVGMGFNLFYNFWDESKGLEAIVKVIESNNLEKQSMVAKRIYKSEDDWDYQVIYPRNFQGTFDPS